MSFNAKLTLFVIIASLGAYVVAHTMLKTTDHFADTFSARDLPDTSVKKTDADVIEESETTYASGTRASASASVSEPEQRLSDSSATDVEIDETQTPVTAFELAYALPAVSNCVLSDDNHPAVNIRYRPTSYNIKGQSLASIDKLVGLYKKCSGGKFTVLNIAPDSEDVDPRLDQRRQDEIKYYLLQRRIDKNDIILPDNS